MFSIWLSLYRFIVNNVWNLSINPQNLFKHSMKPFYNLSSETSNKNIAKI